MSRRQPVNSATAAVRLMAGAAAEVSPPAHVSVPAGAMPFWRAIIHARPREDWLGAPTLMNAAANLAWTQWRIDQTRRMLDGEVEIAARAPAQLASDLLKMQRLEMGYLRVLQQHGRATGGEAAVVAKRNAAARDVRPPEDDDFLAQPGAYN